MSSSATYIEVLMLDGDEAEQAIQIGRAIITPCHVADCQLDDMQRLRFWRTLIAYLLGVAERSVGADGRMAIVQCMRNVPPSTQISASSGLLQ
jgi:hypothetical protein